MRDRSRRGDFSQLQFARAEGVFNRSPYRDRYCEFRESLQALRDTNKREARGQKLLKEWLSPAQLTQLAANGYFDVIGCDSGKRYRIRHGTAMNIHEIDRAGRPQVGWCFVPKGNLVAGDVMLAQKIALENDERAALAVAKSFILTETRPNIFLRYS